MLFVLLTSPAWLILRLFIDRPVECAGLAPYLSAAEVPNIPTCSHTSNSSSVFLMLLMLFMFVKLPTKSLQRSAVSPHNYTLKSFLLLGHSLIINDHEKFRLNLRNEKTISFNFHSSDFQENIFKASCVAAKSNLWK